MYFVICVTHYFLNCSYTFDKIRFPMFMHIKAPDENVLAQLIPEVWWDAQVLYFVRRFFVFLWCIWLVPKPVWWLSLVTYCGWLGSPVVGALDLQLDGR